MIRVAIADDHRLMRAGLEVLFSDQEDIEVVASIDDGAAAVDAWERVSPDVMLMDISMPVMDGIQATREIVERHPAARIIVLTSFAEREQILEALRAGAAGYLLKDAEPREVLEAVRAAARGGSPLSPFAAREVLGELFDRDNGKAPISEREAGVLALVGRGLGNKLIAHQLGISEKTVKAHLTSAFRKIGAEDRTQAALWAQRNGLL